MTRSIGWDWWPLNTAFNFCKSRVLASIFGVFMIPHFPCFVFVLLKTNPRKLKDSSCFRSTCRVFSKLSVTPNFVVCNSSSSRTPALSHLWIRFIILGSPIRCFTNLSIHPWSKLQKKLFRSASKTHLTFFPAMTSLSFDRAWCALSLALPPYEQGKKSCSYGGRTSTTLLCKARSAIQGTPIGRFSGFPGLGTQTRLTGGAL